MGPSATVPPLTGRQREAPPSRFSFSFFCFFTPFQVFSRMLSVAQIFSFSRPPVPISQGGRPSQGDGPTAYTRQASACRPQHPPWSPPRCVDPPLIGSHACHDFRVTFRPAPSFPPAHARTTARTHVRHTSLLAQ